MSSSSRTFGLVLWLCSLPMTLRLIWEMTWLTWHEGPQMIGFSMAHTMPGLLLFGVVADLGLAIWIIAAIIVCIRKHTFKVPDALLICLSIATCVAPSIHQEAWSTATESLLGISPQAPNLLINAASYGKVDRVRYLLDHGVSPDSKNDGCSALAAAANSGNPEAVHLLLERHADPNGACKGSPALLNAIEKNDLSSFKLLVAAGADLTVRDREGFSAYDEALFTKNREITQYLESRSITR